MDKPESTDRFDQPYDFSGGIRGKYAARFADPPGWLAALAAHDVQRELGETLLRLQRLEATLVAYYALLHHLDPVEAGSVTEKLFRQPTGKPFRSFWSDFVQGADVETTRPDFRRQLERLLQERSWAVHRSFLDINDAPPDKLSAVLSRLEDISQGAEYAAQLIYKSIVSRCLRTGSSEHQTEEHARRVIEEWAAA